MNMYREDYAGTIYLSTATARALWKHEIVGQLSDGMWENARPYDHWEFWSALEVAWASSENYVVAKKGYPVKTGYNLAGLIEYVGDRMLKLGRMAKACEALGLELTYDIARAGECMPSDVKTCVAWFGDPELCKPSYAADYLKAVSPELAAEYYMTEYTLKDLRGDLKRIKTAMKSCKR